ncbi:hypothetical protein EV383_4487 [Pseudonocardia sediminis]|uniref:MerR-like DNA binding protein n=1 Tax=Pseudonocardia sediminis TaxID=1397368 RepID=A0A4Q7UZJ2_PSEST|nr:hypothetical protein [Pseudonocardia sediminis]RZT87562.1 hypothetical protein EV383_4487 [Pseudonocardia sediminis]
MTTALALAYAWRVTAAPRRGKTPLEHAVSSDGWAYCGQPAPSGWGVTRWPARRCTRCEVSVSTERFTHVQMVDASGLTYRMADHYVRAGYLSPDVPAIGSGSQRVFSRAEVEVACRLARLVRAGVAPRDAARVARGGPLGPGISIRFDDEEGTP